MIKKLLSSILAILLACPLANAQPGLKDVLGKYFLVGVALNTKQTAGNNPTVNQLVDKHFNSIVAENCFKSEEIQPQEGKFHFDEADQVVNYAQQHGLQLIGHCLVWHSQAPEWFFKGPNGKPASRSLLVKRLRNHVRTVVTHFKGKVHGWDVVNEAIEDDGSFRRSPFYTIIGPEFIDIAFDEAHKADPNAELYYNDYSMSKPGKRDAVCKLVRHLKAKGLRIDAVGFQSHNGLDFPDLREYEASMDQIAATGVKIMMTELDMNVLPNPKNFGGAGVEQSYKYNKEYNPYADGLPADVSKKIDQRWMDFFNIYYRHRSQISRITLWGLSDGDSWLNDWPIPGRTNFGLLFDRQYKPKKPVADIIKLFEGGPAAHFGYFSYQGMDSRFDKTIDPTHQYFNPVMAGFYPDPSVCRVGDTYYLVNSSFSFYPGVPISVSQDLVNWKPLGHVLDRPAQLPLYRQGVSGGIFAPAISYNPKNKTFYMITTNVGAGNFFVKSKDPSKGWSDPIYLRKIDGIDPSMFFDSDGRGWIVHNAPVTGKTEYDGQRAIRLFEFDPKGDSIKGDFKEIVRGGTHVQKNPIWIEGPHLFKRGNYYYLMCAEGGTGDWHSEVIFRAKHPTGPWEECPHNPILTQRTGLDPNRPDIVTSAGHADLVQDKDGQWWAVFLGCRPYEADYYNTGRDTYLLPVTWKDDWPTILEPGKAIPTVCEKAGLKPVAGLQNTGNFSYRDDFSGSKLNARWIFLRNPSEFYTLGNGLTINPNPVDISQQDSPSAIFCRQQHEHFTAEIALDFTPKTSGDLAGLVLLQNEQYNFVFGKTLLQGKPAIVLTRSEKNNAVIASAPVGDGTVKLFVEGNGRYYDFYYAVGNGSRQLLVKGVDAVNLSTHRSGGFIGACIGLYATTNHLQR